MRRLLINIGGYKGEAIDIAKVLRDVHRAAVKHRWTALPITDSLVGYERLNPSAKANVYISAGIHGDEPAGPMAALELLEENAWPADVNLWLIPCLNPRGYQSNTRENESGVDLNRDYRALATPLVQAHAQWLKARPRFDASLLLHEDWESNGFYLYELNPERRPSVSEGIIAAVKDVCPIDLSPVIEGRAAKDGIICANPDLPKRKDWPEAFYLIHHKTPLSYTLEAPSDFPLVTRVQALCRGVGAALRQCPVLNKPGK
ncbi:MAG TPA: M14 family metallocarboxypeptidase [Verrucomicrobiae bacterium]|nr:M14 family metallocarboxypeptidase [Verrucomicrobiae bacterium]